ncbi:hypothetical protein HanIR_Chr10g0492041 [Helianthus annuus]|nr:hypothetical protein HanIR_Chr10g0492041 [Helianthus annuus]
MIMMQKIMRHRISRLHRNFRPQRNFRYHLIIHNLNNQLGFDLFPSQLTYIMQNTTRPKHNRQILQLHFGSLLQTRPPPFQPRKRIFRHLQNLTDLLVKRVLSPRQMRLRHSVLFSDGCTKFVANQVKRIFPHFKRFFKLKF